MTDPASSNIQFSATSAIETIRLLDAFVTVFRWNQLDLRSYNLALKVLGPDMVAAIDDRCTARGIPGVAHDDHEHEFMIEASEWADDLSIQLRDALQAVGITIDEYLD